MQASLNLYRSFYSWNELNPVTVIFTSHLGPEVIKLFSCSTRLSMKFFLPINVRMPTTVGILTFMNRKNSILGLSEPEKSWISWYFHTYEKLKFYAQLSWAWKKFYNLGSWSSQYLLSDLCMRPLNIDMFNIYKIVTYGSPLFWNGKHLHFQIKRIFDNTAGVIFSYWRCILARHTFRGSNSAIFIFVSLLKGVNS